MRLCLTYLLSLIISTFAFSEEVWKPDYLIIGAQKSGTTELYRYINQHPLSIKKEIETHFFDLNFNKGVSWYQNQFPKRTHKAQIVGDKSPYYFFHPLVPERVYSLYPKVKILVILRNPVDRSYSHYWHNVRKKREPLSFEHALEVETTRLAGEEDKLAQDPLYASFNFQHYSYVARSRYVEQMKRWLAFFPKEQILVIQTKDLRFKPIETMNKVFAFLNMPAFISNQYSSTRSDYPAMPEKIRQGLARYFQPYNQELEKLLGQTFNWK